MNLWIWGVNLPAGLLIGFLMAFLYPHMKSKKTPVKVFIGFLAGFGAFLLLNIIYHAAIEAIPEAQSSKVTTQEQHWPDGKLKARREVTKDDKGKFIANGKATTWYQNGQVKWQSEWRNGRQVGKWTDRYENGSKEGEGEINEDGTGFETHWYPNGKKKSEGGGKFLAKHGKMGKHGKWTVWHQDGHKLLETEHRDNQQHGITTGWHSNGKMSHQVPFKEGKAHGKATVWDENGKKTVEETYKEGKLIKQEEFD
jgi:antitoxin component YwqK of YwqJK toxin-antitoxin module